MNSVQSIVSSFVTEYKKTPLMLKVVDCFLAHSLITALVQFSYMLLVGSFPFNSFLAGFLCSTGSFVLTACLRMQVDPNNKSEFKTLSIERAFADYVLCSLLLYLLVWNFMG